MKRSSPIPQTTFTVDRQSSVPIYRQAYDWVRSSILSGRFSAAAQLPATRILASEVGVSRVSILQAYEQLLAEGYATGKVGAGTFVAQALPDRLLNVPVTLRLSSKKMAHRRLSKRGDTLTRAPLACSPVWGVPKPFRPGVPSIDAFPWELWNRLCARCLRRMPRDLLSYPDPGGYAPLRRAIATHLRVARAVRCESDQVIVVPSGQHGLDLVARVLLDPGDTVWIEDPSYLGAQGVFRGAGAKLIPIPVDKEGLLVEVGLRRSPHSRLAYVTPSHQYPLGVTMSYSRRVSLLNWAHRMGAWVVEDDYDGEYRYVGQPLESLQGLDDQGRVIYLGTFSKVLFPSLRLGYLVVPRNLVAAFTTAQALIGGDPPSHSQVVVNEFIEEGYLVQHIRQMRREYAQRQSRLVEDIRSQLQGFLEVKANETGLRLIAWLPHGVDDTIASERAALYGIEAPPLSAYSLRAKMPPALVLGYAAFRQGEISKGVAQLARALTAK